MNTTNLHFHFHFEFQWPVLGLLLGGSLLPGVEAQTPSLERATAPASVTMTLSSAAELVRARNPQLNAARLRIAEAEARVQQAGLLENPEVESEFDHDPDFREFGVGIGFTQAFPVTARLRLEKAVSQAELRAARAEVENVARLVIARTREAVVNHLALLERQSLVQRQMQIATELAENIDAAVQKGEGSPLDANQAKVESSRHALENTQLAVAARQQINLLKPLLGLPATAEVEVTGLLPAVEVPPPTEGAPESRPDFLALQITTGAAERAIALERAKRYGDVNLGLFASGGRVEDAPEGLEYEARVGLKVSIPLPLWNKNQGAVTEKVAAHRRLQLELEALANEIRNEAESARADMSAQAGLITLVDTELLPPAARQVQETTAAYRAGLADLESVLRARDQEVELAGARLDAVRDFHLARVLYEAAVAK